MPRRLLSCLLLHPHALLGLAAPAAPARAPSTLQPPAGGPSSIALVLRGQAFRPARIHGGSCLPETTERQLHEAQGLISLVVEPLEKQGRRVDLYVSESSGNCSLVGKLLGVYNGRRKRVVASETNVASANQADGLRNALNLLQRHAPHGQPALTYSHVLVLRHDLEWHMPITSLRGADWTKFNFLNVLDSKPCRRDAAAVGRPTCVNDAVQAMPAAMLPSFVAALGHAGCFGLGAPGSSPHWTPTKTSGHRCDIAVAKTLEQQGWRGEERIGFLTDYVSPHIRVKGNPVADVV